MAASEARRSDYPTFLRIPTRWHDNDAYGHVNNVVYYAYFDTVVNEHLIREGGLDIANGPAIAYAVETSCRFHRPLSFPEVVEAGLAVEAIGRSSVVYDIGIFGESGADAAATGRFVHVWVDRASGRPAAIPERVRAALAPLLRRRMASAPRVTRGGLRVRCERMTRATQGEAKRILGAFLGGDEHYRASSTAYGDGGAQALDRALDLLLARPELGFVWLAFADADDGAPAAAGACVVCHAISTSRGSLVAKLDDVHVDARWQGRGVGEAMLAALFDALRDEGATRVDTSCHRDNARAWAFYERLGFVSLDEERIARLLDGAPRP